MSRAPQLPAPVSGYVAKRAVQLGQRVAPGAPLMAIVPLDQVWVDANFKEPQLATMRVGQPVTLKADLYGKQDRAITARSRASAPAPARRSRCCRRRTPPATGSRSSSACRCASRSTRRSSPSIRCRSACRCRSTVDTHQRDGERLPQHDAAGDRLRDRRLRRRRRRRSAARHVDHRRQRPARREVRHARAIGDASRAPSVAAVAPLRPTRHVATGAAARRRSRSGTSG